MFNAEIQDGCQKWQESDFGENSAVDCPHTQWTKNFIEIALSRSVSEISRFLCLTQKSRWLGVKRFLQKVASRQRRHPVGQKIRHNRSISLCYRDKLINAEIQDGCQKWRKNDFCQKLPVDFVGQKFRQNRSISFRF